MSESDTYEIKAALYLIGIALFRDSGEAFFVVILSCICVLNSVFCGLAMVKERIKQESN